MFKTVKEEFFQARTLLGFILLQTLGQAISMAVPLVIAKLFSTDMWGRYSLCEPIIFFFSALLILSAKTPIIIYANQERAETGSVRKTFSIQCIFLAASIVLFATVILIFQKLLVSFANIRTVELFYISLAFVAIITKDFASNLFMALNERIKTAYVELAFGLFTLIFLFAFYELGWIDLKSVFLSYFVASLAVLAITLFSINTKMLLPLTFNRAHFLEVLNYTLWMMAGAISVYITTWAATFVLRYYATIEDVGIYNLASKFFKGIMVLIYIFPSYFLPHISENINNPEKVSAYLAHKRPRILVMGLAGLIVAWVLIPYVLNILYANKFMAAVPVTRILLIGCWAFLYTAMYGPLFGAMKIYKFPQIATTAQMALTIGLNLLLIPRFGLTGAAISTVSAYIFLALEFECYYRWKMAKVLLNS
jgi:O-antigen/teichoic acid export membrane protein